MENITYEEAVTESMRNWLDLAKCKRYYSAEETRQQLGSSIASYIQSLSPTGFLDTITVESVVGVRVTQRGHLMLKVKSYPSNQVSITANWYSVLHKLEGPHKSRRFLRVAAKKHFKDKVFAVLHAPHVWNVTIEHT